MAPFPIGTFVRIFLDQSKDDARRLIRHEMESMLDPLVESLFKQLKDKFVDYVGDSCPTVCFHQRHQTAHGHADDGHLIPEQATISNAQQYHFSSLSNASSINANCQLNSSNHQPALMSIKQEINDPSMNILFEPQQNDYSINSSSWPLESMIPSTSIDQSLQNTQMPQQLQAQQLAYAEHNQFNVDECDGDEFLDGEIKVKEEEEDNDDDEQEEESSYRPVKRPRMDTTQPNNAQPEVSKQFTRQPTDEVQLNEGTPNEEGNQMGSEKSEAIDTLITVGHYSRDNSDESMVIQRVESDATNAIGEESIAPECTTNPTQPNLVKSNRHLQCSHCLKSLDRKSNLQGHLRVHTGERPFECDQCGKQFGLKGSYKTHLRTHSGERPYNCEFCGMSFVSLPAVYAHKKAKHLHVKHRCKRCGRTSIARSHIITHIRVDHFGLPPTIKQQREHNIIDHRDPKELLEILYTNNNDSTNVRIESSYCVHQNDATNAIGEESIAPECTTNPIQSNTAQPNRHLQCSHCPKSFAFTSKLEAHLRTHSGERPFRCKVCGHTSTQRSTIIKHVRMVHFGLPRTVKKQLARNIIDHRDPGVFVEELW